MKYVRINQIIINWISNYYQSHYSNGLITNFAKLRSISRNVVVPDNVRVTVHFVSLTRSATTKLLSGTPVPTRCARVTTNQNKTREYLGLTSFRGDGPLFAMR